MRSEGVVGTQKEHSGSDMGVVRYVLVDSTQVTRLVTSGRYHS